MKIMLFYSQNHGETQRGYKIVNRLEVDIDNGGRKSCLFQIRSTRIKGNNRKSVQKL